VAAVTAKPILPGSQARDALEAVREALDIPNAATVGDQEIRDRILQERVGHAVAMLRGILGEDATVDIGWSTAYLRARLAEHPGPALTHPAHGPGHPRPQMCESGKTTRRRQGMATVGRHGDCCVSGGDHLCSGGWRLLLDGAPVGAVGGQVGIGGIDDGRDRCSAQTW